MRKPRLQPVEPHQRQHLRHALLALVTWQAVDGEGVIGQTPTVGPGQRFSYTSGAPLATPSGMMTGTYDLVDEEGAEMVALIPAFSLDSPYDTSRPS